MSEADDVLAWRKQYGWTQAIAAQRLGVSVDTVRGWETGRRNVRRSIWVAMSLIDETERNRRAPS